LVGARDRAEREEGDNLVVIGVDADVRAVEPPDSAGAPSSLLVYADGLDYLRIGEWPASPGARPFGPVGSDAVRVTLDSGGVGFYESPGGGLGRRLTIFTEDTSLFLETSLPRDELLTIASSMPVHGIEAMRP